MNLEDLVIKNIRKYRKMRHISQEKLAELCNTSTSYIGLLEIGKNIPKLSTLERIATALNIEPHMLLVPTNEEIGSNRIKVAIKEIESVLEKNFL